MCKTGGPRCNGRRAATTGAHAGAGENVTVPGDAVGSRRRATRTDTDTGTAPAGGGSQVNIGAVTSGGGQVHAGGDIVGAKTGHHGEKPAAAGNGTVPDGDPRRLTRDGFVSGSTVGQGVGLSSPVQQGDRVGIVVGGDYNPDGSTLEVVWLPDGNTSQAARKRAMTAYQAGERTATSVPAEGLIALDAYLPDGK